MNARRLLGVLGVGLMIAPFVPSESSAQTGVGDRVELAGTGAWSVNNQMNLWRASMYDSKQAMDLSYIAKGDRDGRQVFARGDADFVVSGMPMTAEDQAILDSRHESVIAAPVSVGSLAFLWSGPYPTGVRTFTPDPVDPEAGTFANYTGTLRLPDTTLAKTFVDRGNNNWYDPDFAAANQPLLPAGSQIAPILNPTAPLVRSDPSAENYFLLQVLQKYDPAEFMVKLAENQLSGYTTTESWPFLATGSRTGSVNTANLVAGWQSPKESLIPTGGVITGTSVSEALNQKATFPQTNLFIPEVQNGAGEWVAPTPASISLAIDKTDGVPLAAMNLPIPGAYPFVWVDRLYAPASGLDIDKTNGLATLIRYSATAGQDASDSVGEGRLSEKLVGEALAAADQLVAGNCVGSDRKIVVAGDGGPLWPNGATMPVGSFTVCTAVTAPTTTTTPSSGGGSAPVVRDTSVSRNSSSSPVAPYSSPAIASPTIDPGSSAFTYSDPGSVSPDSGTGTAQPSTSTPKAPTPSLVSVALPLKPPSDGRGPLDRFGTMLLGGILLVVARGWFRGRRMAS